MIQTTPPTYREILLHMTEVSAMHYQGLPQGVIRHYGTCMLYQAFLACTLVPAQRPTSSSEPYHMRWLRLYKNKIDIRFGICDHSIPNNGKSVGELLVNCLKFDPIFRAFIESDVERIIECNGVVDENIALRFFIKEPPRWLWVGVDPWARLEEAGREMHRISLTPEVNSPEAENVMQRRVLEEMLDKYEPKAEEML